MSSAISDELKLLTRREAADLIRVSLPTLDAIISGKFDGRPPLRVAVRANHLVRIALEDVKAWIYADAKAVAQEPVKRRGRPRKCVMMETAGGFV